jgi:hypothetical protein
MTPTYVGWRHHRATVSGLVAAAVLVATLPMAAAELQPRTVKAFERYVAVTEAQRAADPQFLWLDGKQVSGERREGVQKNGDLVIEKIQTRDRDRKIDVPDGLIHHWLGAVFVPGATVDQALALLQDYDRHGTVYAPNVARSRLIDRAGDTFRLFLRFHTKRMMTTVVVNSEHEARFTRIAPDRAQSRIYSTRIAEVEEPDTRQEREKPVGNDRGYLWRLNSYWRLLERDGGVYVECESISLTRGIPWGAGWIVNSLAGSLPGETLEFTLETTHAALTPASKALETAKTRRE